MNFVSSLSDSFKLVVQPHDSESFKCLESLGFQKIPSIPQLLYMVVVENKLDKIFLEINQSISETSQRLSRCLFTRLSVESNQLLLEFLQAQPLNALTSSVKYGWFFEVLINQSLFFKYQPIFDLKSGKVFAHECLARAIAKDGSCLNGKHLIDAALATQCIHEFDELARKVCIEAIANLDRNQTFFINILPNAILQNFQALKQNFQQILSASIQPQQIVFELTETEALVNSPELTRLIAWIREQGFGVAVDDLCGSVSFENYFTGLHPNIVKLDRKLVHGCSRHPLQQVLIKSLLNSAHEVGILVLAEGLEELEDIEFCRDLGIDFAQGYGLGMPELTLCQTAYPLFKA